MKNKLPMKIFRAEVTACYPITPGMIRVVFGGPGLAQFPSTGVGDEYVRLFFPRDCQTEPNLPVATETAWMFEDDVPPAPMRTYTIREARPGAGEIVIDFVVHEGGVAANWALCAAPGDALGLNTPTGLYDPPDDLDWQLLLADATALPAAARIIEQSPPQVHTRAVLEVTDSAEEQVINGTGDAKLSWIHGGNGHSETRLEEVLRSVDLPEGPGYVWVAGEARMTRSARKYLRHELGLPATAYKAIGYWTLSAEEYRERFERLDDDTRTWLTSVWQSDAPAEEREDEYVVRLESLGL